MKSILEYEELFNDIIRPLDDAITIVSTIVDADLAEMLDADRVHKLASITRGFLNQTFHNAVVFFDALEADAKAWLNRERNLGLALG
jgi:hypothetical protein